MAFELQFDWKQNNQGEFAKVDGLIQALAASGKLGTQSVRALENALDHAAERGLKLESALKAIYNESQKFTGTGISATYAGFQARQQIPDLIQSLRASEEKAKDADKSLINLSGTLGRLRSVAVLTGNDLGSLYGIVGGLNSVFGAMSITAVAGAAAVVGIGLAVTKAAFATAQYGREITNLSAQLGTTIGETQILAGASQVTQVNVTSLAQAFRGMSRAIGEGSEEGRKQQLVLTKLGVDPYNAVGKLKDNFTLLKETLASLVAQPAGAPQEFAASTLFGRGGIQVLKEAKDLLSEITSMTKDRALMNPKDIDTAKGFNDQWERLKINIMDVVHLLSTPLIDPNGKYGIIGYSVGYLKSLAVVVAQMLKSEDKPTDLVHTLTRHQKLEAIGNFASDQQRQLAEDALGAAGKARFNQLASTDVYERLTTDRAKLSLLQSSASDARRSPGAAEKFFADQQALRLQIKADQKAISDFEGGADKAAIALKRFLDQMLAFFKGVGESPLERLRARFDEYKDNPEFGKLSVQQQNQVESEFHKAAGKEFVKFQAKHVSDFEHGMADLLGESDRQFKEFDDLKGATTVINLNRIVQQSRDGSGRFAKGSELPLPVIPADFQSMHAQEQDTARDRRSALQSIASQNRAFKGESGNPLKEDQQRAAAEIVFAQRSFIDDMRKASVMVGEDKVQATRDAEYKFWETVDNIRTETEDKISELRRKQHAEESVFLQGAINTLFSKDPGQAIQNYLKSFAMKTGDIILGNVLKNVNLPFPHSDSPLLAGTLFGHDARKETTNINQVAGQIHSLDSMDKLTSALESGLKVQITVNVAGSGGGGDTARPSISVTGGPHVTISSGNGGGGGASKVVSSGGGGSVGRSESGIRFDDDYSGMNIGASGGGGTVPSSFGGGIPTTMALLTSLLQKTDIGHNVTAGGGMTSVGESGGGGGSTVGNVGYPSASRQFAIPSSMGVAEYGGSSVSGGQSKLSTGMGSIGSGAGIAKLFSGLFGKKKSSGGFSNILREGSGEGGLESEGMPEGDEDNSSGESGGGYGAGTYIAAGASGLEAVMGFKRGGAKGITQGIGGVLGTVAAFDPEPISKAILMGGAFVMGLVSKFLGTSREARKKQISDNLAASVFTDRLPMNITQGLGGGFADFGSNGEARGSSLSPYPQINEPQYSRNSDGTYTMASGQQMSAFGGGDVHLHLSAIDSQSGAQFLSSQKDTIAEQVRQILVTGDGISLANAIGANT